MLCMAVLGVNEYLKLSRGTGVARTEVHCNTQCSSLGSLVFAHLGRIKERNICNLTCM